MENKKIELVVCYIRVSTQEQKLHGISLDAQRDKLKEYAEKHGLKIVGWYEDEGVSGRKLIKNRPALQRMLKDAQAGNNFTRILFIKLDRYFRSVAEYWECQKILEAHKITWTATEEKYDLSTANGRAFVNMKLTIAELEADQTGERIDLVNEYKVKTGQALTGAHCQGYGFTVKNIDGFKRVVKDPETQYIVEDYVNHFLTHHNKRQAQLYVKNKYHIDKRYTVLGKMLTDTKLYGHYRGNDDYCEPYVDKATFNKIQEILKKNIKKTAANRVFIFTGLVRCPKCGKTLSGKYNGGIVNSKNAYGKVYQYERNYYGYRCNEHSKHSLCTFKKQVNEQKIEKYLLDNMESFITATITEAGVKDNRANVDNEAINKQIKELNTEMSKVKRMYRKGDMTEAEYDKDMEELKTELQELESQLEPVLERDLTIYEELLKSDWKDLYRALNRENKRAFWRKYVQSIELNVDGTVKQPIFF